MAKNEIVSYEDQLAAMALESVKAEQSTMGATFLSTKGGQLAHRGEVLAGNKLQCVILAAPIERLYYDTRYDPTKIVPPTCFAIAYLATGIKPIATIENPQHTSCDGCPKNEWGSATNGGKGKACRETRRLLLIPVDAIGSADAVEAAEVASLRPPVTSIKAYTNYVQTIATTMKRPPLGVVTEVAVVPDPKTQFKVTFSFVKAIEDEDVIKALVTRSKVEVDKAIANAGLEMEDTGTVGNAESERF